MSGFVETPRGTVVLEHANSKFATWVGEEFPGWDSLDTSFPLMQMRYPVIGCLFYLVTHFLFAPKQSPKVKTVTTQRMRVVCVIHNFALMAFSGICFYNTVPMCFPILSRGLHYTACVSGFKEDELWKFSADSFGFWVWLFYLSKFYEFADTWIVIAKGRRPIFLQVFHHIGAVFTVWMAVSARSCQGWIGVTFNSFVHTWMYAYYLYSSLGYRFKYKNLITKLQMGQLIIGNCIGTYMVTRYFFYEGCSTYTNWDALTCVWVMSYTTILVVLFNSFYAKAYKVKDKHTPGKKTA